MLEKPNSHHVIYLADDDEDDRMIFLDAVKELNLPLKVEEADDGHQLLDHLYKTAEKIPEIIFLDINMPGKNGFECLKEIRNGSEPYSSTKIIMLSTSSSEHSIELSYELGADFYAVKPSTYQGLKKLLQGIFTMDWNTFTRSKTEFLLA